MQFKKFKHKQDFCFKNNRIYLTQAGKNKVCNRWKKITGSRLGAVLGVNNFLSPFQVWCDILGFYTPEIEEFFISAGRIIEPKLLKFISEEFSQSYKSYSPQEIQFDLFKNQNKIFGGIPDGELFEGDKVVSILEIKTTTIDKYQWFFENNDYKLVKNNKNLPNVVEVGGSISKWFKNNQFIVPLDYQYQLSLYLYLRGIDKGHFCVAFLNLQDYLDPNSFSPTSISDINQQTKSDDEIKNIFSRERVIVFEEMKIDLKKFQKVIDFAENWYEKYVIGGISPELTTADLSWFRYGFPDL